MSMHSLPPTRTAVLLFAEYSWAEDTAPLLAEDRADTRPEDAREYELATSTDKPTGKRLCPEEAGAEPALLCTDVGVEELATALLCPEADVEEVAIPDDAENIGAGCLKVDEDTVNIRAFVISLETGVPRDHAV
ncbi:hypothetical protein DFH07DRAFT_954478 [Mycena maculata]|uniref:Uncharacterized protein n=1 Tax=Mycena maculata TaxID=230809 RepID=A0AAD7JNL1_9AGAR|nr:hypothetical protein DFH07DRAFT_954478 [Mycena maculata]